MAEKPKMRRDLDWKAIKREYVEGMLIDGVRKANPTLEEVAERFDLHVSIVRKRAATSNENWSAERELFQARLETAQREKTTEILASKGAEFDALSLRNAEKMFKVIERQLDAALAANAPLTLTPNQLAAIASGARQAQHVGRLVMGDSTDNARLYAELLQKPDLSNLSPGELEQLEQLLAKARPAGP
jgi:hypothetical protein